jgi:type IV secretory pathway VirB10-like protein
VPIGYAASGRLTMTAVSDYPGPWRATLDQPIYTIDRRHVLFPEGSVIVGRTVLVGGQNQAINNRLGFLPTHIVRPDGEAFSIRQQAVLDELGIGAIADQVDYHLGTQLAAVGAFSAIEALPDIIKDQATNERDVIGNFFEQGSSQGQVILQRYLTLLPTVTVRAGTPMRIFFQEELVVPLTRPRDRFELTNIAPGPAPAPAAAAPATRR